MRILGIDFGQRRIGLALSDVSATLASPWKTVQAGPTPQASAAIVAGLIDDEVAEIVVGVPRRLNGEPTDQTTAARAFATALGAAAQRPIIEQDERLSSHEADERLAVRERDWRRRKEKLDAAAAAVILQDYLDHQPRERSGA